MATTLTVKRIDVLEGPNLDELMRAFKFAMVRSEVPTGINVRFAEVVFFGEDGNELADMGRFFIPKIVGIRYLGNEATPATCDDFVITVTSWTTFKGWKTFEGHYNTRTRKGSLHALK